MDEKHDDGGKCKGEHGMKTMISCRVMIIVCHLSAAGRVDAHVLAEVVVPTERLVAARMSAFERYEKVNVGREQEWELWLTLFVGVNAAHMTLQMLSPCEALSTAICATNVRTSRLLYSTLFSTVSIKFR
jgi:hypothetical protein